MRGGIALRAILAHAQPDAQIFFHREMRKNLAALRHISDADPGALFGGALEQIDAIEGDAARSSPAADP